MRLRPLRSQPTSALELADGALDLELKGPDEEIKILEATLLIDAETAPRYDEIRPEGRGLAVASSAAVGAEALKQRISWVSIVWSARRSLEGIDLGIDNPALRVQLKVADSGPWYPPTLPVPLQHGAQRIPALVATGALLSFVSGDGKDTPSEASLESLCFKLGRRPLDLSVSVGDDPPLAIHPAAFAPGERWCIDSGLTEALQRALDRHPSALLRLRSSSPAHLATLALHLRLQRVVRTWIAGAAERRLSLAAGDESIVRVRLPPGEPLERVTLRATWTSARERAPAALPDPSHARDGQRLRPGWIYAQRIDEAPSASASPIVGVDLHIRPLEEIVRGRMWLVGGRDGRPDLPSELPPTAIDISAPGPPRSAWISIDLLRPIGDPQELRWMVLEIDEGELLWTLARQSAQESGGHSRVLYRRHGEAWLPRHPLGAGASATEGLIALHRIRNAAATPAPRPTLALRRVGQGETEYSLRTMDDGTLGLSAEALADLNETRHDTGRDRLEIVARTDYVGELRLFDLQIALAAKSLTLTTTRDS